MGAPALSLSSLLNACIHSGLRVKGRRLFATGVAALVAGLAAGCGEQQESRPSESERPLDPERFSVMTFNVDRYAYQDRTGDGQAADMKPVEEREAVIALIAGTSPDMLALQEMGGGEIFDRFQAELAEAGLRYPFVEMVQQAHSDLHLALLSRYPIVASQRRTDDRYTMRGEEVRVKRGFLEADIRIHPDVELRLLVAQLKSKEYHVLGHTEMRRSEARLLNNHVRQALNEAPDRKLLLVGDLNDHLHSAPVRTLLDGNQHALVDLRPADEQGDVWTDFDRESEVYQRFDYLFASPSLAADYLPGESTVLRHANHQHASRRRPLFAVFRVAEVE